MKKLIYILSATLFLFASCDDFLDHKPSKTNEQEIETTDDINLLLNATSRSSIITDVRTANLTDDWTYHENVYRIFAAWLPYPAVQDYCWNDQLNETNNDDWTMAYESIWQANFIINNIYDLAGDQTDKDNLKAEAHLLKAYKYLALATKYCLYPGDVNGQEMGLPLKNSTEFGLTTVRASLEETFAEIEANIQEGLKIDVERIDSWRESTASAAALAARYYLYVHDFENAKKYATQALSLHSRMINMETEVTERKGYGGEYDIPSTADLGSYAPAYYTGWESQYKIYHISEFLFIPSNEFLAAFQPEDLRLRKFITQGYLSFYFGLTENNNLYTKFSSTVMTGTDAAEMYLILAECEARENNYAACMQNVEMVRVNRFNADEYSALPLPTTQKEAVQVVVDERRREMPYTALRWADIKRLNNEGLIDPIIVTRDFYELGEAAVDFDAPKTYTLEANSRKYARPLPQEIIDLTEGTVKQNTY
ncbi:RagB/SusD family nutrient uptake outer membrane protein [Carboxylicivirga sp. M1479]|uniref:RagB/SusD family nutrient uptake outer membrane protein n=1 Tax=Carboxylicivirga sp. M1479 TaxID=2594476 RepID=UPI0011773FF8|nr:RagB/SusD family nutrient uptake outer membrane protein [Carboxylicivirga sp. M1479]TRX71421.1 RagB/SusD family nutrient uptake outer membrane protein [Carboxylicivirga sp. M1479]